MWNQGIKGYVEIGREDGATYMEGLALDKISIPQPRREVIEISPYRLLDKATALSDDICQVFEAFWNIRPKLRLFSRKKA